MIFNLNNIVENLILSFIFYSAIWSIGYSCNNLEHKLDSLGIIWVYITTVINLIITYLVVTKVVTRFVNFKPNNSFNNFEYGLLMFFSLIGFFSLVFYKDGVSEVIAVICDVSIILFLYEFEIIRKDKEQDKLLKERDYLLERQKSFFEEKIELRYESIKKIVESDIKISQMNHDLNRHFNFLLSCEGLPKEAKDYINKIKK